MSRPFTMRQFLLQFVVGPLVLFGASFIAFTLVGCLFILSRIVT